MNTSFIRKHSLHQGRSLNILLAAIAAFAIGITISAYKSANTHNPVDTLQKATYLQGHPRALPNFSLTSHLNTSFSNKDLKGEWNLIFFGFTHCPDVCPLTLNTLNQVATELKNFDQRPRNVFISVDPKRDTPEELKQYVEHFNQEMIGLTGSKEQIDTLTKSFGAIYAIANNTTENYLVDHSAQVFVVAPDGKMVALFNTPHDAKVIAEDFKIISAVYETHSN